MSFRVILAELSASERAETLLAFSAGLARRFDAHLNIMHIRPDPRAATAFIGEGMSGVAVQQSINTLERDAEKTAGELRKLFESFCHEQHFPISDEPLEGISAGWHEVVSSDQEAITSLGRLADLILFDPLASDDEAAFRAAVEMALFESARPALIIPPTLPKKCGQRIVLAWNGSSEAVHAVASAMPFLRQAETVLILSAEEKGLLEGKALSPDDLCNYLSWNKITATGQRIETNNSDIAEALMKEATEWGADLFVMGAYSHSRYREMFFGGVTRDVMGENPLCVLMAR